MKNIPDSLTPDQAWIRLSSQTPLAREIRSLEEALGHHLACDVEVPEDVPAGNRSFMDGFAVRSADVNSVPCELKISGEILMGKTSERKLQSHEAMFIPTGGFLPDGADAVVMQEDTELKNGSVIIKKSVAALENVQRQGEDFQKSDLLFAAPHRLRVQDLSALATFGISEIPVVRKPILAILSTGNELVHYHQTPEAAQIRETNALSLSSAAKQQGFVVHSFGIIQDLTFAQKASMTEALNFADVILVSGGSSVGERDYTLEVIQSFPDHKIHFHGLAIRPGNPTIFASIASHWVFGLPGQPVSSLIVFYQFVLPFLFHLSGETINYAHFAETKFLNVTATLEENIIPLKLKTDYVRLRLLQSKDGWLGRPVLGKSASLSTLAKADAFTIVPPGERIVEAGRSIKAYFFP
jgi:molybdopterin molybdotransferase